MNAKLRDCSLFRLLLFVIVPVAFLAACATKPKSYVTGIVITIGIYIVLCASLNLINGFSGMFSMGHAAFMAIGAYISAFLTLSSNVKENMCPGLPDWRPGCGRRQGAPSARPISRRKHKGGVLK